MKRKGKEEEEEAETSTTKSVKGNLPVLTEYYMDPELAHPIDTLKDPRFRLYTEVIDNAPMLIERYHIQMPEIPNKCSHLWAN